MHNQSKNTKANKTKKKNCFFLMTSAWYCSSSPPAEHGLVLEKKKKKFSPKILRIFWQKYLDFHPQTSILQSKPKKMHKKRIIARTKQALIFEISPNELQKPQKGWVLLQTIFSTSIQPQLGLKTKNKHQTKKKNCFRNQKTRNPKIT